MVRGRTQKNVVVRLFASLISLILALVFLSLSAFGQTVRPPPQPSPSPDSSAATPTEPEKSDTRDPIERSDEFKSKLTFGTYFTPGARVYDLNLRHQFGPWTAWIAGFYDPQSTKLI